MGIDAPERGVDADDAADGDPAYPERRADADPAGLAELEHGAVLAEPGPELEPPEPGERERQAARSADLADRRGSNDSGPL